MANFSCFPFCSRKHITINFQRYPSSPTVIQQLSAYYITRILYCKDKHNGRSQHQSHLRGRRVQTPPIHQPICRRPTKTRLCKELVQGYRYRLYPQQRLFASDFPRKHRDARLHWIHARNGNASLEARPASA